MLKFALLLLVSGTMLSAGFETHTVSTGFWGPSGIHVTDMNGDELPDILGSAWNDNEISYWLNSGDPLPEWERHLVTDSLYDASFCSACDVNQDGLIDIAATGWEPGKVMVFLGNSDGSWTEYTVTKSLDFAHEVHLVDVDQDGLPDIIAAAAGAVSIVWWKNNGETPDQWDREDISTDLSGGRSVCAADFDGDGDVDLAGCGMTCDDIRWWENSGDPVPEWTEHSVDVYFNGAHMVRAGDINGDGHIDLAGAGFIVGRPGIWLNSGTVPVTWEKHLIADNIGQALGVDLPDLNCDGLPDLAATSQNPHQISVWINNGGPPSTWEKNQVDGTIVGAWPLGSGDFNGDGNTDLAAGGNASGYIRWYENNTSEGVTGTCSEQIMNISTANPSEGIVTVTVQLEETETVKITVLDFAGRRLCSLWEGLLPVGGASFTWDGTNCSTGVYLIRAESSSGILSVKRVTLLN